MTQNCRKFRKGPFLVLLLMPKSLLGKLGLRISDYFEQDGSINVILHEEFGRKYCFLCPIISMD